MTDLNSSRKMIEALKLLKEYVEEYGGDGVALYAKGDEIGLRSVELSSLRRLGVIVRSDKPVKGKLYSYWWKNGEPTVKMLEKMYEELESYQRVSSIEAKKMKKAKKEKEAAAKLKEAKKEEKRIEKLYNQVVERADPNQFPLNLDFDDTEGVLKAAAKPYPVNSDHWEQMLPPEPSNASTVPNGIEISVTSEGGKKTINIKIEI